MEKTDFIAEGTCVPSAEDKMRKYDGFYSLIKDEADYQRQCELTPTWY